ncbi:DUF551 domain-containing protein [Serratia marcescens]|uniref:DUF551 domain-containing protein n=1 Tax=Serratia marcescens TaxID=615 RepID=UPI0027E47F85|nr:DUF551 domain-containing protein [Serratia marcescens]MDI3227757.1 DUF551 domain-containing protein [Serratia marcescens]
MTLTTERQQFEEWFNEEMVLHISASNETVVRLMWKAWQASRELLANREAQPVACDIERIKRHALPAGECPRQSQVVLLSSLQRLLTAPPAPAVLTDEQIDAVLDSRGNMAYVIADKRERLRMFAREILRTAMLAQPVSSGYKLPESWIPCSEQTPVADGAYWCWFGKEKPSVIQQRVCIWNDRNHEWCDSAVTHWMPLPAAPEGGNENN